jgi:hypothetical protein
MKNAALFLDANVAGFNGMYERFLRYWVFLLTEIELKFTAKHKLNLKARVCV